MSQSTSQSNHFDLSGLGAKSQGSTLPGVSVFNRKPLTPEQQMQALKRVQAQAEQRVKLGMQLFKAAETRLTTQTDVLQQIKTLQSQLREQLNEDVAKTLQQYDQWIGQIDESFTTAIRKLEEKVDAVQKNLTTSESRMQKMLERAESMLDQTRELLSHHTPGSKIAPASGDHKTIAPAPAPTSINASSTRPPDPATPLEGDTPTPNATAEIGKPSQTADALPNEPLSDEDHKIYSKLLQRLIEENPTAESHPPDSANHADDEDKQDHADAA